MTALRPSLFAALVATLALAGCASGPITGDVATGSTGLGVAVAPERAMAALPPEAGNVVSVVERRGDGSVEQTITLMGDATARGDDRIEVAARERRFAAVRPRLDAEAIEAEMAEALPGVAMRMSSRVVTTPSGPVGIATGRSADGRDCLYAWSTAEARGRATGGFGLSLAASTKSDLTVRVRLCRRGLDEERLIALAEGLRIRADLGTEATLPPVAGAGGDALAAAGYASAAPIATAAPVAAPKPTVSARTAEPARATAKPPVVAKTAARPAATPEKAAAATNVAPIPLPASGG